MKTHQIIFVIALFLMQGNAHAQLLTIEELEDTTLFVSLERALKSPDKVFRLHLKGKNLKSIPPEIFQFKNLNELNLTRNRIREIPPEIGNLQYLQILNLARNKIEKFPAEIGKLINLRQLIINQNEIEGLPPEIGNLAKLELLDMWSNNIDELPAEISNLKNLKEVDMRAIFMSDAKKEAIEKLLPDAKIHFSPGCNCGY